MTTRAFPELGLCVVDGCTRPVGVKLHRLCMPHYQQLQKYGSPTAGPGRTGRPPLPLAGRLRRFFDPIGVEECWPWTGTVSNSGYGRTSVGGATLFAHRVVYELLVGPIPEGLTLDHLCRNRRCVNPAHLEPVTMKENIRRADVFHGIRSATTHCKRGHAYDAENTVMRTRKAANGRVYAFRECRACARSRRHALLTSHPNGDT